jgi:ubiquinone biosynthesis protein Coq4
MIGGGRIQLNGWQQAAVAVGSAVGALLDPRRADLIAALGETTGKHAFERVVERMKKSPEGRVGLSLSLYLPLIYASSISWVMVVTVVVVWYD